MRIIINLSILLLLSVQYAYSLNPSRTYKQRPEKFNMACKEVKVKTNDGESELNTWFFPSSTKTTKLVLIAHNGEGNMADYLRRVDQFINASCNVMIFDYRGFGESGEFEIDNNMYIYPHFQNDVETMIDYCRMNHAETFTIYGWGIGGGLAFGIGYNRPEITKIIADTPFLSMEDLEERFSDWDTPMEVPFAGYDKRFEPAHSVENSSAKNLKGILIILGSNDVLFKKQDYEQLKRMQPKLIQEIFIVENPNRIDNFKVSIESYSKTILTFLDK